MLRGETINLEVPSESESACSNDNVHPGETNSSGGLRTADCMEKTNTTETNDTIYQAESDPVETLPELNCKDKALDWSTEKTNIYEEDEYFKSSRQVNHSLIFSLKLYTRYSTYYLPSGVFYFFCQLMCIYYIVLLMILVSQLTIQEQPSTSSPDFFESPTRIQRVEDSASTEDKGEHPSPVSVLEQFFVDAISEPGMPSS